MAIPIAGLVLMAAEAGVDDARYQSPLINRMATFEQNLAVVLHLTNPDDYVMDGKGETIFRNRPTYWVLEGITLRRIATGADPE